MTKYLYAWANNPKRAAMKGRVCTVIARGKMNSVGVQFWNGQRECVSRFALRKLK